MPLKPTKFTKNKKRKGKDIAYIPHPLTVALILSQAGAPEDVVVAGVLHDTIEDSVKGREVTPEMLTERFGKDIAEFVTGVSEESEESSWQKRKEEVLKKFGNSPKETLFLKSADVIANLKETMQDYEREGDNTFNRFGASKEATLRHKLNTIKTILANYPENPLKEDLNHLYRQIENMME